MLYNMVFLQNGVVISSREIEGDDDNTTLHYENKILEGELKVPSGCDELHFNRKHFNLIRYANGYEGRLMREAKNDTQKAVYVAEPKKRGRPATKKVVEADLENPPVKRGRGRPRKNA